MGGFIDLTDINIIKSLPKDIIDDNWIELNYLYNKALVEGDLDKSYAYKKIILVESLIKISDNIIYTINFASTFNTTCNNT